MLGKMNQIYDRISKQILSNQSLKEYMNSNPTIERALYSDEVYAMIEDLALDSPLPAFMDKLMTHLALPTFDAKDLIRSFLQSGQVPSDALFFLQVYSVFYPSPFEGKVDKSSGLDGLAAEVNQLFQLLIDGQVHLLMSPQDAFYTSLAKGQTLCQGLRRQEVYCNEELFTAFSWLSYLRDHLDYASEDYFPQLTQQLGLLTDASLRYERIPMELRLYKHIFIEVDETFAGFLSGLGAEEDQVNPDKLLAHQHYSLLQGDEITSYIKWNTFAMNSELHHLMHTTSGINQILQQGRSTKKVEELQGYMTFFKGYYPYMPLEKRSSILSFLFELLTHRVGVIRRMAGDLMGEMLVLDQDQLTPLIEDLLYPDQQYNERHKKWLRQGLSSLLKGYFNALPVEGVMEQVEDIWKSLSEECKTHKCYLSVASVLPYHGMRPAMTKEIYEQVVSYTFSDHYETRLMALDTLTTILLYHKEDHIPITEPQMEMSLAEQFGRLKVYEAGRLMEERRVQWLSDIMEAMGDGSKIFLSNAKTTSKSIVKKLQMELLLRYAVVHRRERGFYTAMHYCNLLKLVPSEQVKQVIADSLVYLSSYLTFEERNDVIIELLRSIETESHDETIHTAAVLGVLLLQAKPSEFDDFLLRLKYLSKKASPRVIATVVQVTSITLQHFGQYCDHFETTQEAYEKRRRALVGILLNGYVHYEPEVYQQAMFNVGTSIFGQHYLSIEEKGSLYQLMAKKLLSLSMNHERQSLLDLLAINESFQGIHHFLREYEDKIGPIRLPAKKKIAFFPGSFDPFSMSHKEITMQIRNLGYEVYLSVDEFSWSKRTQPNIVRRDIIKLSVADQLDIFVFPRDIQVNIANNQDLERLKGHFPTGQVSIVVGSDVIVNASAYQKNITASSIQTFPHVVFLRPKEGLNEEVNQVREIARKAHMEITLVELDAFFQDISSSQIRSYLDENRDVSSLIDPLAQQYIYDRSIYLQEPSMKETMSTKSIVIEVHDDPTYELVMSLAQELEAPWRDKAKEVFPDQITRNAARVLVMRHANDKAVLGFTMFHWVRSSRLYAELGDEVLEEQVRTLSFGRMLMIDGIYSVQEREVVQVEQLLLTETLAYGLGKDYTYGLFQDQLSPAPRSGVERVLALQGFLPISHGDKTIYHVNMSNPCTLSLDAFSMIKEPFSSHDRVRQAVYHARARLQEALTGLYPGNLVLAFDRMMIYETLINKICHENKMPTTPLVPKKTGPAMCVPFGEIFKKRTLPNTVTKSLHTEKYFKPDLSAHEIKEYPEYLDLRNQVRMIKSFNRPVILVDDLLNKGYRIKAIDPYLKEEGIDIRKVFVGILSGRGKALMDMQGREVDAAYFIPRLRVWFNESKLYPFIGGDSIARPSQRRYNVIPSVNLLLPYASGAFINKTTKAAIYGLSLVALENAHEIMTAVEAVFEQYYERSLTLGELSEVMTYPRYPDHGSLYRVDLSVKPSTYLQYDIEQLQRLSTIVKE